MNEAFHQLVNSLPPLPEEGVTRLERTLGNMERGNSTDFRTPFWGKEDRATVLERMESEVGYVGSTLLDELDLSEKSKVGPFSIRLPWAERRDSLEAYSSQHFDPDRSCWDEALRQVKSFIRSNSLRRLSKTGVKELMPRNTSLGLPLLSSDFKDIDQYLERAQRLKSSEELYDFIGYSRTQPKGLNEIPKNRLVWGADHAETIIGATFWYPLLKVLRSLSGFSALVSPEKVDESMTRIIDQSNGVKIVSMDFSGYDASVGNEFLREIFELMKNWFSEDDDLNILFEYAAYGKIVVPYERWGNRTGGIPSGMVLTTACGCLGNILAGVYASLRLGVELKDYEIMGDDAVYLFDKDVPIDELSEAVWELGLTSNPDKVFIHKDGIHFLQRLHTRDYRKEGLCVGVHSIYRSMSSVLGYERMTNPNKWNEWMDTIRLYMIANVCSQHPLFERWLRFLKTGDRNFGISPLIVAKRAGGVSKIAETLRIPSFPFNQKDPRGLANFKITKVLQSW